MPRHPDNDDEELEEESGESDDELTPGDSADWEDWLSLQHDRDDDFGAFFEGLDHLDDIFDYPDDDDWYPET